MADNRDEFPTGPPTGPPLFDDTVPAGAPVAPTLPPGASGPTPPSAWQAPPTWGSAAQGWPPPPATGAYGQTAPPSYPSTAPPSYGAPTQSGYTPNAGPPNGPMPGAGGGAGGWNYGYPPAGWVPPQQPGTPKPPNVARRVLALVAVIALVLASAGAGAAISAATHNDSNSNNNVATSPFGNSNGSSSGSNNPFGGGTANGSGNTGNGSTGNGNGTGSSTGNSAGSNGVAPAAVVSKVNASVVDIYTTITSSRGQGEAAGTGMIISSNGLVLTNNHVIDGATSVNAVLVANGARHDAEVLGYSVVDDVALLKIDDVSGLTPVTFADASSVNIGDNVVAIGNAGGRGGTPTATTGSVTALDQKVTAGDAGTGDSETLHGMIQISAPIEPGDSGGPLADDKGDIIGMNTAAAQSDDFSGQSGSSTAFAIPIQKARSIAEQIEAGQNSDTVHIGERGILGVQVNNAGQGGTSSPVQSGAAIADVQSGGPADDAGLQGGDTITTVEGQSVASASDLTSLMFPYHPGDKVDVGWVDSSGGSHHGSVTLIAGPPA